MPSSFNHVDLSVTYTTPDGRKRAASLPAEPAQVDPNDDIAALSMILIAANDRIERLETLTADLLAALKPILDAMQGPEATMDFAPEHEPQLVQAELDWSGDAGVTAHPWNEGELKALAEAHMAPVDTLDV